MALVKHVERKHKVRKLSKRFEMAERRKHISMLYLQGMTMQEISDHLKIKEGVSVSLKTVCFDLQAVKAEWQKERLNNYEAKLDQELARINAVELKAWESYEMSRLDAVSRTKRSKAGSADGGDEFSEEETVKGQCGDPRFLNQITHCVEMRLKLLGLLQEQAPVQNNNTLVVSSDETKLEMLLKLAERVGQKPVPVEAKANPVKSSKAEVEEMQL